MEKPGDSFAQAETELPEGEILSKDTGLPLSSSGGFFTFLPYTFLIYKQLWSGLSSRSCLYFQGLLPQSCLMVA